MSTTPDDDRRFRRNVSILLLLDIAAVLFLVYNWESLTAALNAKPYAAASPDEVFSVAAGTWDWTAADSLCVKNPHTISFSSDRSKMFIAHRQPWTDSAKVSHRVSTYLLESHSASEIRGAIVGETRRTVAGEPVVWDLVLTSPSTYAWHRTDWLAGAVTNRVIRCPPGTDSLVAPP